jgi:hypothetical protein
MTRLAVRLSRHRIMTVIQLRLFRFLRRTRRGGGPPSVKRSSCHRLLNFERSIFEGFPIISVLTGHGTALIALLNDMGEFMCEQLLATRTIKSSITSEIDLTVTSESLGIHCARHF